LFSAGGTFPPLGCAAGEVSDGELLPVPLALSINFRPNLLEWVNRRNGILFVAGSEELNHPLEADLLWALSKQITSAGTPKRTRKPCALEKVKNLSSL
jgi:hypothetical protein